MSNNDDAILKEILGPQAQLGNPHVIQLLEQALMEARQGRISGCAIVKEGGGNMAVQMAGQLTAAIYFGCDLAKDTLKAQLTGGGRGGGILRMNG